MPSVVCIMYWKYQSNSNPEVRSITRLKSWGPGCLNDQSLK